MTGFRLQDFGLSRSRIILFSAVSVSAAVAEGAGMAVLLPVLEFIEKGRDLSVLAGKSEVWEWIVRAYGFVGVEIDLASLLIAALAVMLIRVLIMYVRKVYTAWVTQDVLHSTRVNLFKAYLGARYSFFDSVTTGQVVNVVTTETTRTGGYFSSVFNTVSNGLVIIGYLAVLLWISVPITLLGLVLLSAGGALVVYYIRNTKRYSQQTTMSNKALSFLMVERLTGIRLIKLSAAAGREGKQLHETSEDVRDNMFFLAKLNSRIELILEPVVAVSATIILYTGVDYFGMSLSKIGLFMLVLLRLLPVAKEFLRNRQNMLANSASFQAVREGLSGGRRSAEDLQAGGREFGGLEKEIRYEKVDFSYPDSGEKALDAVDLSIPAGRITALVGPSGSGKSTLIDLLPMLRRPQNGRILLDGVSTREFDLHSLRRGIAFVSQDAAILNDTVFNNIAFAMDGATRRDVEAALAKAKAEEFVRSLPDGLDTVLGERGLRLSGGQRQRLSLARAFVKKAPIMILDEPTSALDSEVERDIQHVIDEMRRTGEATIVIIAHRLSTVRNADKIVVLSAGRVVEEGSHEELTSRDSWYAKMLKMQGEESGLNGDIFGGS